MLPDNFNDFEFLQDIVRKTLTKHIRDDFDDLGDDWTPSINTPRAALRVAITPKDDDSAIILLTRLMFYYFTLRKAQDMQAPIYGIPIASYDESFKYRPTVTLYFKEDQEDVDPDYQPLRSSISYRLMKETSETISIAELTNLARKIKAEFNLNNGFRWKRGKTLCCYCDKENGFIFRIFAWDENEGKQVISKILSLENKNLDATLLSINKRDNESGAFPTIPPNKMIAGEMTRLPRKRPVGYVRYTHATCQIWGKAKPIVLHCRTGLLRKTLID